MATTKRGGGAARGKAFAAGINRARGNAAATGAAQIKGIAGQFGRGLGMKTGPQKRAASRSKLKGAAAGKSHQLMAKGKGAAPKLAKQSNVKAGKMSKFGKAPRAKKAAGGGGGGGMGRGKGGRGGGKTGKGKSNKGKSKVAKASTGGKSG